MKNEIYKPITNYETLYEISYNGLIKNLKTNKITRGWKHNTYGHRKVRLYKNNVAKDFYLHRLVAIEFIDNPHQNIYINHIDNNPDNNNSENLEWCTHQQNMHHAKINNRFSTDGKKVIHKSTGNIFKSIKDASEFVGIKPNTLVYQLRRKGKSQFELIAQ
jgi:uncharacterized iron-regulated protein